MPLLGYKDRFGPLIQNGTKKHTIRNFRKRPFRVGDMLYMYTGLRTKWVKKICEEGCTDTLIVQIAEKCVWIYGIVLIKNKQHTGNLITIIKTSKDLDRFARNDGFENWETMMRWFRKEHGLPYIGNLICWHSFTKLYLKG